MGLCPKPFVINCWLTPFTFPSVPITFSHVLPWFSKQNRGIPYVPIRSKQPFHKFGKKKCSNHPLLYAPSQQSRGNG